MEMIYLINQNELKALIPQSQIFGVLGVLLNNPEKLLSDNVCLDKEDFQNKVHRIIFFAINNIIKESQHLKEISAIDVDTYLTQFEQYHSIFTSAKGIDYIQSAKDNANVGTFNSNYHYLKKMTVLRKFAEKGIDISDIYDIHTEDVKLLEDQQKRLSQLSEEDIVNHFTQIVSGIRNEVSDWQNNSSSFSAGDDIEDFIEHINDAPQYGYGFKDGFMNSLTGGMQLGKLFLRSMKTGGGKTRLGLTDLINVSITEQYNWHTKKWVKNDDVEPSLFISTELDKHEIQIILLSAITNLTPEVIRRGNYDPITKKTIAHAAKVLHDSPMHFKEIQDFSIDDVMSIIDEYVFNYDVKYVNFDYIQAVPKLLRTGSELYGGRDIRDDRILLALTDKLRAKAKELDIFIQSATQISPSGELDYEYSRTERALRDSKSIADKIDVGVISAEANGKDLKNLENLINNSDVNPYGLEPNMGHFIYKNRLGKKSVVIWTYTNLGTLYSYPLFVTDYNYNLVDVPRTKITVGSDGKFGVDEDLVF